jgi:hypothetical protein
MRALEQRAVSIRVRAAVAKPRSPSHLLIAIAMSCTMFLGFSLTYFGPIARGEYPAVSPMVHVHGWTFFAWYVLLPLQAGLIQARRRALHRTLGLASLGLGAAMILVGLLVTLVQIEKALAPDGDPFWQLMGVPIFGIWILFTIFYVEAMRRRRHVEDHKRLILLASAAALTAATARIGFRIAGFSTTTVIVGMLVVVVFPLLGILHDRLSGRPLHPVYAWGVPALVAMIAGTFLLGMTPGGDVVERGLGLVARVLWPLYLDPAG